MELILILDSSNTNLTVGLIKDKELLDSISYPCFQRQSEVMIPEIETIFKRNNFSLKQLNGVVVTIGPGSYTGIRIALTIAKIISTSLNIPLYPVSSLESYRILNEKCITLINARSNRSYIAIFDNQNIILKPSVLENDKVMELINQYNDFILVGDLKYLGLEGHTADAIKTLSKDFVNLKSVSADEVKPLYLKDLYE